MSEEKFMSGMEFRARFAHLVQTIKDEDLVYFGNADLTFSRLKERGPKEGPRMVQIEFGQMYNVIRD